MAHSTRVGNFENGRNWKQKQQIIQLRNRIASWKKSLLILDSYESWRLPRTNTIDIHHSHQIGAGISRFSTSRRISVFAFFMPWFLSFFLYSFIATKSSTKSNMKREWRAIAFFCLSISGSEARSSDFFSYILQTAYFPFIIFHEMK